MSVVVENLIVEYVHEGYTIRAVDDVSFEVAPGEIVALLGPSGCGKTTTLSCLAGILTPTSGRIEVGGVAPKADLIEHRRSRVGIVFQAFNLIPSMTARENVAMPLLAAGMTTKAALARADELIDLVGLSDRRGHLPGKLSGGQQQRVAIARALVHDPPVLLADEPTANLDYVQSDGVIKLLRALRSEGRAVIISTHDDRILPIADRAVRMVTEATAAEPGPGEVPYAAGDEIFAQGDRGELAYVVERGEVDIVRVLDDGEQHLATLGPGQYFGELAPLIGFPRSASARAKTDVLLRAYQIQEFREKVLSAEVGGRKPDGDGRDAERARQKRKPTKTKGTKAKAKPRPTSVRKAGKKPAKRKPAAKRAAAKRKPAAKQKPAKRKT